MGGWQGSDNIRTNTFRIPILVSRFIFLRSRNLIVPFVLTDDVELLRL